MNEGDEKRMDEAGLRIYEHSEDGVPVWVVSGVSKREGRRWRRRFQSRTKAEDFLDREMQRLRGAAPDRSKVESKGSNMEGGREVESKDAADGMREEGGGAKREKRIERSRVKRRGRARGNVRVFAAVFLVVLGAYGVDRRIRRNAAGGAPGAVMAANFEVNPVLSGWNGEGEQVDWAEGGASDGRGALIVRKGRWISPGVATDALGWYRLSFRSKQGEKWGEEEGGGELKCAVNFQSEGGGGHWEQTLAVVRPEEGWKNSEIRFRAHPFVDGAGNLEPAIMRVKLSSEDGLALWVDELRVEAIADSEVEKWADGNYAKLPARLSYVGKETRWRRLTGTMERLRNHQRVRIVFAGDAGLMELSTVPLDVFLKRLYPGCVVEPVCATDSSVGGGGGGESLAKAVVSLRPDLVILGGGGSESDLREMQTIVDRVREQNTAGRRRTEILLLSKGWGADDAAPEELRFTSDMKELDQEVERNPVAPEGMRGRLLRFAADNGVEFLDMMGIASEYVFGAGARASEGRPTGPDGVPYIFRERNWWAGNEIGGRLMGRVLEAYFSPTGDGRAVAGAMGGEQKTSPVRIFDPEQREEDRSAYEAVKLEFGVSAVERPALAVRAGGEGALSEGRKGTGSAAFRVSAQTIREVGYVFDEPLDVRLGDVAVYWSFRSDRDAGEEMGKLTMQLTFSDPTAGGREDRSQVALAVRPGAACILGVGGGAKASSEIEHLVEAPVENFIDPGIPAKFRMLLRWVGGGRIVVEAASWNGRSKRWEGFIPFERPGAPTLGMELNTTKDLLGTSTFKSIHFETQSGVPKLESVLVTMRPSMLR